MTRTAAIRDFQQRVHAMESSKQNHLQLSAQQARNLNQEISELLAELVDQKEAQAAPVTIEMMGSKF